jgi:putative heme-binding domain-containing protein
MRLLGALGAALLSISLYAQEEGARIYASQCAYCHGPQGDGGRGANLARPKLRHTNHPAALAKLIREGIPGTEMPRFFLANSQLQAVANYVLSLGRNATETVSGNASRGAELYAKLNCVQCHTIRGRGGAMGPDLTGAGARTGPTYLRESLTKPAAALPPGFLQLRIVTVQGESLNGILIDEDTFSIRIRDFNDRVRSYFFSELRTVDRQKDRSPMPSYAHLNARDLDDLVAYLASLQETE